MQTQPENFTNRAEGMISLACGILLLTTDGKEAPIMNENKCIECTVSQCANHCHGANYCSLDKILVGTHECNPTVDQCTDCMSFRKK